MRHAESEFLIKFKAWQKSKTKEERAKLTPYELELQYHTFVFEAENTDSPLSAHGCKQVEEAKSKVPAVIHTTVYVSPFRRTI